MTRVELITGPAGAGKTARVLAAFRAELIDAARSGLVKTALWLTPGRRSRQEVLAGLLGEDLPVCFAPQVLTFDEFAGRLLRTAAVPPRLISQTARRKLLRDIIDDLERQRRLRYFGPVAATAGFLELCGTLIAELKREEVWPEDYLRICNRVGGEHRTTARDRELADIYAAYQARLHAADGLIEVDGSGEPDAGKPDPCEPAAGLFDNEGRFWAALQRMRHGCCDPCGALRLVVADGFTDFTRTQCEMLATLARWTGRLLVTLPADADARRLDLFAKPTVALGRFQDALNQQCPAECDIATVTLASPAAGTALAQVSAWLFDNPREVPLRTDAAGLRVLACVREAGEIETVAREVKRLLVHGTRPDDIVVAFRTLDDVADRVRGTFTAAGLPYVVANGLPIARTGAVRLLRGLLDLERDDWTFDRLTGLLGSLVSRTEWLTPDAVRAVVTSLRDLELEGGREVLLSVLRRRAEPQETDTHRTARQRAQYQLAWQTLNWFSEETALLHGSKTFGEWVSHLVKLAGVFGLTPSETAAIPHDDGTLAATEYQGWQAFVRLMEEVRGAQTLAGLPLRPLPLEAFRRQFDELLAGQKFDLKDANGHEPSEVGCVRVLPADQVRNLAVPHLFLCGLSESNFPASRSDDCLYGDAERRELEALGLPLGHRARHSREEMLLFYGVVTRARRSLTLSFPEINDAGEPLYRSPYLQSLIDLFSPDAVRVETHGRLDPVPATLDECITGGDLRTFAVRQALVGDAGLLRTVSETSERTVANVAAAAQMAAARYATTGLTNYEGVLHNTQNRKRLRQRYPASHQFSVTELEAYACNPFRFFLANVLRLEPTQSPAPGTDHLRRGGQVHAALAAMHRKAPSMQAESDEPLTAAELTALYLTDLAQRLNVIGGDTRLQRAMHSIERRILTDRAGRFEGQWQDYLQAFGDIWDGPPETIHPEIAFGNAPEEEGDTTAYPPAAFGPGEPGSDDRVLVRGRIDRIDVGTADGQAVYNVIDYKTGGQAGKSRADLTAGQALQLVVYAAAARQVGLVGDAALSQVGYWGVHKDGFVRGIKDGKRKFAALDPETVADIDAELHEIVPRLARRIRNGQFSIVADDPAARYYPQYVSVARTSGFAAVADALQKQLPDDA